MFYDQNILRKGAKFYLVWLADSWPLRFALISSRQLMSQNIPQLCEMLQEVLINESGQSTRRFSLRLSSQLMRGLVRMYQRQASIFLNDLCMIYANVIKHSNKRYNIEEVAEQDRDRPQGHVPERRRRPVLLVEEPDEQQIEQLLQNNRNVVADIQDITLKEAVINEPVLPPNEGFGEENIENALQFLSSRRSIEQMMVPTEPAAHHSALDLPPFDTTDKSHDKTRLAPHHGHMERLSGQDLSVLRPSDGGLLSTTDLGKDIPEIPEIPNILIHEMPLEKQPEEPGTGIRGIRRGTDIATRDSTQIDLEELEDIQPKAKRRRKLIIDKNIRIRSSTMRTRIRNPHIELRCKDSSDAVVKKTVPYELYMHRPCHAGYKERSYIAQSLTRLYMRNLGIINRDIAHRELEEEEMQRRTGRRTRSLPEHVSVQAEPAEQPEPQIQQDQETMAVDIADMVTQKLKTLSLEKDTGKRPSGGITPSPKKQRSSLESLNDNQKRLRESAAAMTTTETGMVPELEMEFDKENIAANEQIQARAPKGANENSITAVLLEAGLSDLAHQADVIDALASQTRQSRRQGDESPESLLGSLDRTKVSLGDSDKTTESKKFIKDMWGSIGTMYKIMESISAKQRGETVTIKSLIAKGPIIDEYKNIITAKCFTSVLKLKQSGYITIKKCPNTLEILDIMLGPKFA